MKRWPSAGQIGIVICLVSVLLISPSPSPAAPASLTETPPPGLKVAFIGDQGLGVNPIAVLQLIEDEGSDLVIHAGDFDYTDDPAAWDQQINDVLGSDYPYFISVGNHDLAAWSGYQQKFQERLDRISDVHCVGDLGVKSYCIYQGLFIILSGVGTMGSDHAEYIERELAIDDHIWRICSWHKNQNKMQVGGKADETGWGVYEACLDGGAIVATAHEHSYSRTYSMSSFENQTVVNLSSTLELEAGKSFVFVSGLAGKSIRDQEQFWTWMASVYTSDQSANYGALFCTFNVGGFSNHASCYFKDIDGAVPDTFDLVTNLPGVAVYQHTVYLPISKDE